MARRLHPLLGGVGVALVIVVASSCSEGSPMPVVAAEPVESTTTETSAAEPPTTAPPTTAPPATGSTGSPTEPEAPARETTAAGSTDGPSSEALSFAAWHAETMAVCREVVPRFEDVVDGLATPSDVDGMVDFLDAVLPAHDEYVDALVGVGVPSERGEEVEQAYELLRRQGEDLVVMRDALSAGRPPPDAFADSHDEQTARLEDLLMALDVTRCIVT